MSKVDGRKIPHPVREAIRHEAIQKWEKASTVVQLSEEYGTDPSCVRRWIRRFKAEGPAGLKLVPLLTVKMPSCHLSKRNSSKLLFITRIQRTLVITRSCGCVTLLPK